MIDYGYYDYNSKNTKFSNVRFPMIVNLLLTNMCNLECMFCSVAGDLANNNSMSLNIAKKIIDECAHNGVIQVNYSGGEPFLYDWDDLSELLKYGNKNKINQTIATNGTLLDLYMIRWIKPYIKSINISLHGDREHHNYITKNDCYDDVIRTIRNCYEEKVRVNLLYTLSKENLQKKNILSVIDIANKYKCGIFIYLLYQ